MTPSPAAVFLAGLPRRDIERSTAGHTLVHVPFGRHPEQQNGMLTFIRRARSLLDLTPSLLPPAQLRAYWQRSGEYSLSLLECAGQAERRDLFSSIPDADVAEPSFPSGRNARRGWNNLFRCGGAFWGGRFRVCSRSCFSHYTHSV